MARRTRNLGPGIGRRLNLALAGAEMTIRELALKTHTSTTTVMKIKAGGGGNSGVGLLADIARALGVRAAWLILGEGERS